MKNLLIRSLAILSVALSLASCGSCGSSPANSNNPNVIIQSITLFPLQASGDGSASPNQWQIAQNTSAQTMVITYANMESATVTNFTVNTSNLSSGYTLNSNGCNGVQLSPVSGNSCQVILNVNTATTGEKDLLLTPLTSTWTGQSTPLSSEWINPSTLTAQTSVFVNVSASLANVVTQSIVLLPLQASGNGSATPNQWQIANGIIGQTMIITYANVGNTNANAFAVNTSNLSTGYTLITNSCSGGAFILTANSANVCQVILSVNTTTIGEKNLLLTPLTSTWTGLSTPQASVWVNPITLISQSSVFVSIAATPPLPAANVVVQSIILSPLQASGNGSAAPNQWQIANGTSPQTMTITYVNTGAANAAAFTINTSSLSSGYSLSSNSCSGGAFTLTANSLNTCQVILNVATTTIGEKDLFLTPLTSTWTGLSTPQASVWINPTTLFAQSSVGVNIAATPIPPAANVIVQSVTLAPIQASGNGSTSPNQWQIANGTFGQTMTITYANTGTADAVAFAVNTSSLSSGYVLNNNSCNGGAFTLTAGSLNTCQVILNMTTTTAGEEDFFLTPLTSTWNAQSIPQPSIWPNPITLLPQASVFVNIAAAPPPVPTVNVVIQSITMLPLPNSGNGSATPNQWQIANGTNPQTMIITYANTGTADAAAFAVNTTSLSAGYTLASNSCSGGVFTLTAGSLNTCQVILGLATATAGEEDLTLMPVAWTGGSATPNWLNPITLVGQSSVFVNISAVIPPPLLTPAIYGFSGVTSSGLSVINGDVDTPLTPTSVTGFTVSTPPGAGIITGTLYTSGAAQVTTATVQALSLHTAATALAPACFSTGSFTVPGGVGHDLSGFDLGSVGPLPAGVYCFSSSAGLTGTLTLNGGPTASYTFLIASTLTTATSSIVNLTAGTLHQNVFWDVGSGVTFGTGTSFQGVIDSSAAITDAGGSSLTGNAWSRDAAVTLIGTTITP